MRTCFGFIFWGLLIVVLNISINGFDLLPNGLGYILIAVGCRGLTPLSQRFGTAQLFCWLLAVLWLIGFVVQRELAMINNLAMTVANCLMIWQLLGGIIDFATYRGRTDLAERASTCRIAYVVIMLVSFLLDISADGLRDIAGPLVVIVVISVLVVLVMILLLIRKVRAELTS